MASQLVDDHTPVPTLVFHREASSVVVNHQHRATRRKPAVEEIPSRGQDYILSTV